MWEALMQCVQDRSLGSSALSPLRAGVLKEPLPITRPAREMGERTPNPPRAGRSAALPALQSIAASWRSVANDLKTHPHCENAFVKTIGADALAGADIGEDALRRHVG